MSVPEDLSLKEQIALVTGSSRGIGRAIALRLSRFGAKVLINYSKDEEGAVETKKTIEEGGGNCSVYNFSVADYGEVEKAFERIKKEEGHLEILINNAGITKEQILPRTAPEDWEEVIAVNLKGAFNCSRFASRLMVKKHYGRIINISSVVAHIGTIGQTAYSATKAGLEGLTRALALELAHFQITVNAVAPGLIETSLTKNLSWKFREEVLRRIPLQRAGTAEEVASLVHFLATPAAGYITGQVFHINGGLFFG